jgi:hypothetical protein
MKSVYSILQGNFTTSIAVGQSYGQVTFEYLLPDRLFLDSLKLDLYSKNTSSQLYDLAAISCNINIKPDIRIVRQPQSNTPVLYIDTFIDFNTILLSSNQGKLVEYFGDSLLLEGDGDSSSPTLILDVNFYLKQAAAVTLSDVIGNIRLTFREEEKIKFLT